MLNPNYVHTLTVYNRVRAADTENRKEHWYRTVLHNCFWKSSVGTTFSGTDADIRNIYTVRIPKDPRYLPYHEFVKKPAGYFTVSQEDIVILGEIQEEITGESGHMAAQVLNRYSPNAFKVTAFSDNTAFPMGKHYRIGGQSYGRGI